LGTVDIQRPAHRGQRGNAAGERVQYAAHHV